MLALIAAASARSCTSVDRWYVGAQRRQRGALPRPRRRADEARTRRAHQHPTSTNCPTASPGPRQPRGARSTRAATPRPTSIGCDSRRPPRRRPRPRCLAPATTLFVPGPRRQPPRRDRSRAAANGAGTGVSLLHRRRRHRRLRLRARRPRRNGQRCPLNLLAVPGRHLRADGARLRRDARARARTPNRRSCRSSRCSTASATSSSRGSTSDLAGEPGHVDRRRRRAPSSPRLFFVQRAADLERYRYLLALGGIGLLLAPLMPVHRHHQERRASVARARARSASSPASWPRSRSPSSSPATSSSGANCSRPGGLPGDALAARARAIGPLLGMWALSIVVMVAEKDLGSSTLFFALFVAMLWVAAGGYLWPAHRLRHVRAGFGRSRGSQFAHVQERVRIWIDPWSQGEQRRLPTRAGRLRVRRRRRRGHGPGHGHAPEDPRRRHRPRSSRPSARSSASSAPRRSSPRSRCIVVIGLRIAQRAERPFEQLLAAGLTTILGVQSCLIIGGVTRLLAVDGHHAAVRVLRRLVDHRQLDPGRVAAAHQLAATALDQRDPSRQRSTR